MTVREYKLQNYRFESSCYRTKEYDTFEKQCKRELLAQCKESGLTLHKFNSNHFQWSAVLKVNNPGPNCKEFVYVSMPDVRFWNWYDDILIRTMNFENDWSGNENHTTSFDKIGKVANAIIV